MTATTDAPEGRRDGAAEPSVGGARAVGPAAATPRRPRGRRRRQRPARLLRALGLTVLSALLPGVGHLAAGQRLAGGLLLTSFVALLAGAGAALLVVPRSQLLQYAVDPQILQYVMIGCVVLGVTWVLVVLSTYTVTRPRQLSGRQRVAAGIVVALLAVGVTAPFALGVRTAYTQHDLISHVFGDNIALRPGAGGLPVASPADQRLLRKPRVNVLLLGGDAAENRDGVRTDSMILASVDTDTGNAVLISLPRNLQRVRFPPGTPMARRFPYGFTDLLNAVYRYGEDHKDVVPGARYPGAELIKQAFGHTVGLQIDYFILVNLDGFRDIVDALGGVRINVERRIPIGGHANENGYVVVPPSRYIEPGPQVLDGYEALWYGRSRIGSDDYERMQRQRCLLGALAKQADPLRVLTRFQKLASATKRIVLTDIPQEVLPELVQLAMKGKEAKITSVTFVRSARFLPHDPDFAYVRARVAAALRPQTTTSSGSTGSAPATAGATPGATTGAAAGSIPRATPGTTPRAQASRAPADVARPVSLDEVCSYS